MEKNISSSYESVVKQAGEQSKIIFDVKKTYPAYLTLIVFLALSVAVYFIAKQVSDSDRKSEYDKAVSSILSRFENQTMRHEQVLKSMQGLYYQNVEVVRDYFELYGAVPAKTYKSILSIAYAPKVIAAEWDIFHFNARAKGYYDYRLDPPGSRDLYYPVEHIVLFQNNINRLGYDYATDEVAREGIELAKENDIAVATKFYKLRPDTLGFCLIAPIYQKETDVSTKAGRLQFFKASLVLEVDAKKFFSSALKSDKGETVPSDSSVIFQIIDPMADSAIVYASNNSGMLETGYRPLIENYYDIRLANRNVVAKFYTIPGFGGTFRAILPWMAFGASLILSFVFFGFIISVMTGKARALDLAERITRSQRRILDTSKDMIAVLDAQGNWKSMNPASLHVLGYMPQEIISGNIKDLMALEKDYTDFTNEINLANDESTVRKDVLFKTKSEGEKWINWSFTISITENLIYAIGRDVTLEKLAEEEARIKRNQIELAEHFAREASQSKSYFMIKLSHQLRNSLTGIIGYLQLLSDKIYDTEEEHDSYLQLAEQSSEEIFTFVSDIVDATLDDSNSQVDNFINIRVSDIVNNAQRIFTSKNTNKKVEIKFSDSSAQTKLVASPSLMESCFDHIITALMSDFETGAIEILAEENPYEGAAEIQLVAQGNVMVAEMIEVFKQNSANTLDALRLDKGDVVMNLAKASSIIRRMNGTMTAETFGGDEGNIVMITMPIMVKYQQ